MMKPKRLFLATLWAGCLDFSVLPLAAADFTVLTGGVPRSRSKLQARWVPQYALRQAAQAAGWKVFESVCASSNPGRAINDDFYQGLKRRIKSDLLRHGPFDAAVVVTSGITRTFRIGDVEGDLLRLLQGARRRHGTTVGFFSNVHAHLDERNLKLIDLFMCLKEYPHTDWADCGRDLMKLIARVDRGELTPVFHVARPRMLATVNTFERPYAPILAHIRNLETRDEAASISILHGNMGVNSPYNEMRVIVTTDRHQAGGQRIADDIAGRIFRCRNSITPFYPSPRAMISKIKRSARRPFVVADYLDNPFGGAAGDSTVMLRKLLDAKVENLCSGPYFDPAVVQVARDAGVGSELPFRIGGKLSPMSGTPLDLTCRVKAIHENVVQYQPYNGVDVAFPTGTCVHLESGKVDIIISNQRQQTFTPELFTRFGIALKRKKCIIVKSKKEYELQFGAISDLMFTVMANNPRSGDFRSGCRIYDYSKLPRPLWPLDRL